MISLEKIGKLFTEHNKLPDAMLPNLILLFSGGFQDAYTYIVRDKVFANAQTGNVVLSSTYFMNGNWYEGFMRLFPIFSFILGIFIADIIRHRLSSSQNFHWKQGIVLFEMVIMIVVGFLPQSLNMLANCMISFACALQLQGFNKFQGNIFASTMCIGNLRSGVSAFSSYLRTKDIMEFKKMTVYFIVILAFAIGAGVGGNLSAYFGEKSIWLSAMLLAVCLLMLDIYRKENQR